MNIQICCKYLLHWLFILFQLTKCSKLIRKKNHEKYAFSLMTEIFELGNEWYRTFQDKITWHFRSNLTLDLSIWLNCPLPSGRWSQFLSAKIHFWLLETEILSNERNTFRNGYLSLYSLNCVKVNDVAVVASVKSITRLTIVWMTIICFILALWRKKARKKLRIPFNNYDQLELSCWVMRQKEAQYENNSK